LAKNGYGGDMLKKPVNIKKLSCVGDIGNVDKKSRAIIDPAACPFVITKEINSGL